MSDTAPAPASDDTMPVGRTSGDMPAERLDAFRHEVAGLSVGGANPARWERIGAIGGLIAMVVGLVIAFLAFNTAYNATRFEVIHRQQVLAVAGGALAIVGALVWLRVSITRHLRWWMIRMVHEQRSQTDRIVGR